MAATVLLFDLGDLRRKLGWFVALGIIMIVFGMIAVAIMPAATIGTVLILGWLMIFSGIVEAIHGFQVRSWGGFFLHLIGGIVGVLIGLLVVTHPVAGALAWTLLFASFFTVIGLFRLIAATRLKFPNWGCRNCAAAAWLVARDDCSSASQLTGSAQRVAPRRVNSPCPEPQSITP